MRLLASMILLGWLATIVLLGGHVAFFWKIGLVISFVVLLTLAEVRDYQRGLA